MVNPGKIIEICYKKNLHHLPALQQLIRANEENLHEDVERIGNNLIEFLKEQDLWRTSSAPPMRTSSVPPLNINSSFPQIGDQSRLPSNFPTKILK